MIRTELDERDQAILEQRSTAAMNRQGPAEGDYVRFPDGSERRVSYVWPAECEPETPTIQTSDGGSWYLGNGYVSFSGSLYPCISRETLTRTQEVKLGSAWFFHHDFAGAGRGIDIDAPFPVWECNTQPPR